MRGPFLHPLPRLYLSTDTILKREAFGGIEYQYQGKEQTAYDILTFYLCKRKNGGHEPIGASTGSEKCGPGEYGSRGITVSLFFWTILVLVPLFFMLFFSFSLALL